MGKFYKLVKVQQRADMTQINVNSHITWTYNTKNTLDPKMALTKCHFKLGYPPPTRQCKINKGVARERGFSQGLCLQFWMSAIEVELCLKMRPKFYYPTVVIKNSPFVIC